MKKYAETGLNARAKRKGCGVLARTLAAAGLSLAIGAAFADPVTVPNGDFSDPGNTGTVGGGLLGGSGVNALIGNGPWRGTYWGIAGLLAPPSLAINHNTQTATIGGIAGVNLLGLVNNGGYFTQTLAQNWELGRFYVLSADVDAGELLNLDLLGDSGVGIAFRSGNDVLASSTSALGHLLDLDLVGSDMYRVRLGYFADLNATGPINIKMGYEPQGVASVDLLSDVTFRNVGLEVRDIGDPAAFEILTHGDLLQAEVGQPFSGNLIVLVRDDDGDGVPGYTVTFTAPTTGASAVLTSPTGGTGTTVTAVTDIDGLAMVSAQANSEAGCYRVTVEGVGIPEVATFYLRNYSNAPGVNSIFCNGYQ
jgi:hypothetical protein